MFVTTIANQESVAIKALYVAARMATAGGGQIRVESNASVVASGGTTQVAQPRSTRNPAANSVWKNDLTTLTAGTSLTPRLTIGFAQTGGMGAWMAIEPADALQMQPGAANPTDMEFLSLASSASTIFDMTIEFSEGT